MELLAGDVDRLRHRFLAEDLLFEGYWRAPFQVASSVLIALSSGECAFPWAVTLCIRLIRAAPAGERRRVRRARETSGCSGL